MLQVDNKNMAIVIQLGERFFSHFGGAKRVQTAWCLAGAKVFAPWNTEAIEVVESILKAKKKTFRRIVIGTL